MTSPAGIPEQPARLAPKDCSSSPSEQDWPTASCVRSPSCAAGACLACHIEGLGVAYDGRPVLADVDAVLPACRVSCLVGPSGCGKSTLLGCLNRLIDIVPGASVSGRVSWGDIRAVPDCADLVALRRTVGHIAQRPNPFPSSIRHNFHLPLREHGVSRRDAREAIMREHLLAVGLWDEVADRLDRSALDLSGGQQQRLCLARAMALRPAALLLDEPCSALDPLATERIEELIHTLRGRYSIVLVTHNLAQAKRLADWIGVCWVRDGVGRLIESGPADQIFTAPQQRETQAYIAGERG